MISMTVIAGWSRQIVLLQERLGMDAVLVLLNLIRRNPVGLHGIRIGMASSASVGYTRRVDRGVGILDRSNPMRTVATDTRGGLRITASDSLPVDACGKLSFLIDSEPGIEALHGYRVAVTLSAERGNLFRAWLSDEPFARIHRSIHIVVVRITAVAVRAR